MDSPSDTLVLVRAAQAGDEISMNQLFERYLPRVRQIVALRLGYSQTDFTVYEDLVQEGLLRVFRNLNRFGETSEGTFRNWVATCIANSVRNHFRDANTKKRGGRQVRRLGGYDSSVSLEMILPGKEPSPGAVARGQELLDAVETALLEMKELHREVILLRRVCGMSYEEVAVELGINDAATARQTFHRATKKLRDRIGLDGVDRL